MRAVLLTHYFTPTINAGTLRWDWLAKELAELGVEITVVGAQPKPFLSSQPADERPTPAKAPRMGLLKRAWREFSAGLNTLLPAMRLRSDVFIVTVPPMPHLLPAWFAAKVRRKPLVIDLRDTWPELLADWSSWGDTGIPGRQRAVIPVTKPINLIMGLLSWGMRSIQRSADLVVTTTESYANDLRTRGFRRVITVRNSPGERWPVGHSPEHEELRVLYLGTVGRAQRLATAIEALALIQDQVPVAMRIVGAGVHVEDLKKLAREVDVDVEFIPKVSRSEVRKHYEWCDTALVMLRDWPSLQMAVPSKLYEAMSYGRHVTASINGEPADIVSETHCGDAVAASDPQALARLWAELATDRSRLTPQSSAMAWLAKNTDRKNQAVRLFAELNAVTHE